MKFTNCVTLVGSKPKRYEGTKRYVSTGALAVDHIDEESVELVGYEDRPSRADLTRNLAMFYLLKWQIQRKQSFWTKKMPRTFILQAFLQ